MAQPNPNWAATSVRRNCDYCVKKKVKCVGNNDGKGCTMCLRKGLPCVYSVKKKPGPKSRKREDEEGYEEDYPLPPSILASPATHGHHNTLGTPTHSMAAGYSRSSYAGGGRSGSFDTEDGGEYIGGGGGVGAGPNGGPPLQHSPSSRHLLTPSKKARPTRDGGSRAAAYRQNEEEFQHHQPSVGHWRWDRTNTDEWNSGGGNSHVSGDSHSHQFRGQPMRRGDSLPILPSPSGGAGPDAEAFNSGGSHTGGGPPVTPPSLYHHHPGLNPNFRSASGIPHSSGRRGSGIASVDSFTQQSQFLSAPPFLGGMDHVVGGAGGGGGGGGSSGGGGSRLTLPDSVAGLGSPNGGPVAFTRLDAGAHGAGSNDGDGDGGRGVSPFDGLFQDSAEAEHVDLGLGPVLDTPGGDSDGSDGSTVCDSDDEGAGNSRHRKIKVEPKESFPPFIASEEDQFVPHGSASAVPRGGNAKENDGNSAYYRRQQQTWQQQQRYVNYSSNYDFSGSDSPISPHHQAHGHHGHRKQSKPRAEPGTARRTSYESYHDHSNNNHQRPPIMPRLVANNGAPSGRRYSRSHSHGHAGSGTDEYPEVYYGGGTPGVGGGGGGGASFPQIPQIEPPISISRESQRNGEIRRDRDLALPRTASHSSLSGAGVTDDSQWGDSMPSAGTSDDAVDENGRPFNQALVPGGDEGSLGTVGRVEVDPWGMPDGSDSDLSAFLSDLGDLFGIDSSAEIPPGPECPVFV